MRLGDDTPAGVEYGDFDGADMAGIFVVFVHDREDRIDGALHVTAAGVWFDGSAQDFEGFAEAVGEMLGDGMARVAVEKTVAAFEDSKRPFISFGRQQGCVNAVLRCEAGMNSFGPRT